MSELTDFLLARIAEDEAVAQAAIEDDCGSGEGFSTQYELLTEPPSGIGLAKGGFGEAAARMIATYAVPRRALAECGTKRAIIDAHHKQEDDDDDMAWVVASNVLLKALASVYSGHHDYREEWRL